MGLDNSFGNSNRVPGKGDIIQDFLTQRSVQSLMHTMKLVGDMENLEYLESFMNHQGIDLVFSTALILSTDIESCRFVSGLSNFHGYGALRTDSATYITTLKKELPVTIVKRKKFYRGGSRNNPYVTDNEFTYTSTVQPRVLADNIIAMREVLAKEWVADLAFIESENSELLRHHTDLVRQGEDRSHHFLQPQHEDADDHSPLRLASYDLLEKLVTEAAVRRVADDLSRGSAADRLAGRWLHEQFHGEAGAGFRGDHGAEVGRTFMRHLLAAVPVIVTATAGAGAGAATLVDPHDVAQRIMAERQRAAERWAAGLTDTPQIHVAWAVALLRACLAHPAAARSGSGPADTNTAATPAGEPGWPGRAAPGRVGRGRTTHTPP
eukprot:CAMPEP_0172165880 /NCGR_PEP_ID=MMETSP1050-20130122/8661_1 /TAXON_ID=233186 /ORGANISM="Cryptomonas curvata, Strain CCAP979/52" /LENGTH=379 /DNA_ID=CAMNT_0012836407 /DNA_START=429 /DNA_END=1567 /DNA_ORIENTATION=+